MITLPADPAPADTALVCSAAVIGAGPAGLMAAERLAKAGYAPHVFDAMPTASRKFLMAGRGGLNLTHAEPLERFVTRYGDRRADLGAALTEFGPQELRDWVQGLGIETFVGSSERVFPTGMKAAPLLRAWLTRLQAAGGQLHTRHRWQGWDSAGGLSFATPNGRRRVQADVTVLALGGGSWARLGSDGAWIPLLAAAGIDTAPFAPSNCGFMVSWSPHLSTHFAGTPLKAITLSHTTHSQRGECMLTAYGLEGGALYALSPLLRDSIAAIGTATLNVDLCPDRPLAAVVAALAKPRGSQSMAGHLRRTLGLDGVKAALLREVLGTTLPHGTAALAAAIKALPLVLTATAPIDSAISTAGGVKFDALDQGLMVKTHPGLFCCGEMLDWEAPTGGYLLTACFATGALAGKSAAGWLQTTRPHH
jgi:uncharacterized flavoprotein (TIGR03862 family)